MPANTVYVGRGSKWGNPFPTHEQERDGHGDLMPGRKIEVRSPEMAVREYIRHIVPYTHRPPTNGLHELFLSEAMLMEIQRDLRGKNLACWCALDQPCHADFLLKTANEEPINEHEPK